MHSAGSGDTVGLMCVCKQMLLVRAYAVMSWAITGPKVEIKGPRLVIGKFKVVSFAPKVTPTCNHTWSLDCHLRPLYSPTYNIISSHQLRPQTKTYL